MFYDAGYILILDTTRVKVAESKLGLSPSVASGPINKSGEDIQVQPKQDEHTYRSYTFT